MATFFAITLRRVACLTILVSLHIAQVRGEAPQVERLFPPGAQRGQTIDIKVTGKLPETTRVWSDRSDVQFELTPKSGTLRAVVSADATPGPAWLRFYNSEGATSLRPFIIGLLPEISEQEPNDRIDQAQPPTQDKLLINGVLQKSGDVDIFAVPLKQGQTVIISLRANQRLGSPVDAVLQLTTARGFVLAHNDDDHQVDPQIIFTAATSDTHYVRVFGFPTQPNSTIGFAGNADYLYRMLITTGAYADHTIPLAGSLPKLPKLTLSGWNLTEATQTPPTLRPTPTGHLTIFHPLVANELTIPVSSHQLLHEQEVEPTMPVQPIAVPSVVTGHIQPAGDVDAYRISAKKGEKLAIRCEARAFDSLLDPVVKLIDPQGKMVKEADDQGKGRLDSQLNVTIGTDGDYRVEIHDRFRSGGPRHAYRLITETPPVDFELKLAAGEFTMTAKKPLEIPVTITRTNGFKQEIEILVEGLPEGVTATPVKSLPKGDSAKSVKLKLVSERSEPFQGTFHIRGRSTSETDSKQHSALYALSSPARTTADIWLTVLKPAEDKQAPKNKQPAQPKE